MGAEHWIVKKPCGEEWGLIKRLIIDPATRQISFVDVILGNTGQLVRVRWESFDVEKKGITLSIPEGKVDAWGMKDARLGLAETVAMDLWP